MKGKTLSGFLLVLISLIHLLINKHRSATFHFINIASSLCESVLKPHSVLSQKATYAAFGLEAVAFSLPLRIHNLCELLHSWGILNALRDPKDSLINPAVPAAQNRKVRFVWMRTKRSWILTFTLGTFDQRVFICPKQTKLITLASRMDAGHDQTRHKLCLSFPAVPPLLLFLLLSVGFLKQIHKALRFAQIFGSGSLAHISMSICTASVENSWPLTQKKPN